MTSLKSSRLSWQPLDRAAIAVVVVLMIVISTLLLKGDRTAPRVRQFSWQDRSVGTGDIAFTLTFSRPMNHRSVENNLRLDPPLPGRISWAGRRMAYTLNQPIPYGNTFDLTLEGAYDLFSNPNEDRVPRLSFAGQFQSRDRVFVYLGVEGDERGRLIMQNLTRRSRTILTPPNLLVMDFQPYPKSDRILFSAINRTDATLTESSLYTVTTGIYYQVPEQLLGDDLRVPASPDPAGVIREVLSSDDYQNLRFDLSNDGRTIAVQRINRTNPADFGIWIIPEGDDPRPLGGDPGGDFLITPDGEAIAILQGEGTALRPLDPEADAAAAESAVEPLDFLPQFGRVLSFSQAGTAAAMVRFNPDFTESLFVVTNQGDQTELLTTNDGGSILNAQFNAKGTLLYALITRAFRIASEEADEATIFPGEVYVEQPFLVALTLAEGDRTDLLELPIQPDVSMSLAPDNLSILFDQITPSAEAVADPLALRGQDGRAIADSELWLLPLAVNDEGQPVPLEPEPLLVSGLRPRWLP
jgi:hypothetical protein